MIIQHGRHGKRATAAAHHARGQVPQQTQTGARYGLELTIFEAAHKLVVPGTKKREVIVL